MEIFLSIAAVFVAWRFLLPLATAIGIGFFLGQPFGPVVGLSVVLGGMGFGLIWQGRWLSGISLFASVPSPPISRPVTFLGLAFIGALWGGFAAEALGSVLAGGAVLVAGVIFVGGWFSLILKRHGQLNNLVFAAFSLLCGLGGLYAVSVVHARAISNLAVEMDASPQGAPRPSL